MEQIAAHAGVSKATLYDNFDSKSGLTHELLDRFGIGLLGRFAKGISGPVDAQQIVRGGIEIFVRAIERDPAIYRFILATNGPQALLDEAGPPVTVMVQTMLRASGADPSAAEYLSYMVLGGVFATADRWATHHTEPRATFVDHLTNFVWSGLSATGIDRLKGPVDLAELAATLTEALEA